MRAFEYFDFDHFDVCVCVRLELGFLFSIFGVPMNKSRGVFDDVCIVQYV